MFSPMAEGHDDWGKEKYRPTVLSTKVTGEQAKQARRLAKLYFEQGFLDSPTPSQLLKRLLMAKIEKYSYYLSRPE